MTTESGIKDETFVHMKTVTWMKDSHSLFDYEFNKNIAQTNFDIKILPKFVFIYRNNTSMSTLLTPGSEIITKES